MKIRVTYLGCAGHYDELDSALSVEIVEASTPEQAVVAFNTVRGAKAGDNDAERYHVEVVETAFEPHTIEVVRPQPVDYTDEVIRVPLDRLSA